MIGGSIRFPRMCVFGEGFYCETAQIFRFLRNRAAAAVKLGDHVSCYAGCSFAIGAKGTCTVGNFTLLNGAIIMAEERIEIGSLLFDLVECRDCRLRFSSARAGATTDRCARARAVL